LDKNALKGKRIGVLRELYETETADFEVLDIMQKALQDLKTLGAELVDPFQISNFEQLSKATGFCSRFRFDLAAYLNDYGKTKPIQSLDEVVKRQLYLSRNQSAIDWAMEMQQLPREQTPPCVGIKEDPRRQQLLSAVLRSMDQHKLDAIVYPSWSNPPRDIGDDSSPHGNNSPVIAPHTGQPAITVPMGFTNAGLPLGLQILARPNQEWLLLNLAYAYEAYSKHRNPPKQFALINLSSKP
ncbi:MAG: amidase family protein, partial [Gammaproteobacteria bacterium]|nr:amidase family protein [Gammaproteobacteria bacterium]